MIYDSAQGNITIAVAGDAMITRPMQMFREQSFLSLVKLLKDADASVVNLEMLFHDYEMSWEYKDTVSFQVSDPSNITELQWMGFDVVTTANNHSYDYSEAGFIKTLEHCKEKGTEAGGGRQGHGPRQSSGVPGHCRRTGGGDECNDDVFEGLTGGIRPAGFSRQAGGKRAAA